MCHYVTQPEVSPSFPRFTDLYLCFYSFRLGGFHYHLWLYLLEKLAHHCIRTRIIFFLRLHRHFYVVLISIVSSSPNHVSHSNFHVHRWNSNILIIAYVGYTSSFSSPHTLGINTTH